MDKETFAAWVAESTGMLYRVAYTILQNDDACADALQESILKAWEKRHSLREERYFRTWLTRIVINTCRTMRRDARRLVSLEDVPEPAFAPPDLTLHLALNALPQHLRLPLVLCYAEGMSYQEAAEALHLPKATVRGRIVRAKKELRKELDAQ